MAAGEKFRFLPVAVLFFCLLVAAGCGRRRLELLPQPEDRVVVAAWSRLAVVKTLESRGVIRMVAADGEKSSARIRLLAAAPGRLKIQWLTPWQTVAWQLLLSPEEFWLTDSKARTTYHGRLASWRRNHACRRQLWWWRYVELLAGWCELLRPPGSGGGGGGASHWPPVAAVDYLVTADGRLPAGKIIRFATGEKWRLELDDFISLDDGTLFPGRWIIHTPRAALTLTFSRPVLNRPLSDRAFTYRQGAFELREFRCREETFLPRPPGREMQK